MTTYQVIVTRDTTESTTHIVAAASQAEAEALAVSLTASPHTVWTQDDTANLSAERYVTDVMRYEI